MPIKRKLILMLILNIFLTVALWSIGFYLMNLTLNYFDSPVAPPGYIKILSKLGEYILGYLTIITLLLSEKVQLSIIGTILSYLSAFVMISIATAVIYFGCDRIFKRKIKS